MRTALVAWCACATLAAPAAAQRLAPRAGAAVVYERFSFGSAGDIGVETLSLLTVPLGVQLGFGRSVELGVSGAWARGEMVRDDGSESTISGPTDTELRLAVRLGRDMLTLTGIALLPTGTESLSIDEADVAGAIAADVLPFRISNWGTGGGVGGAAAIAGPIGSFAAGVSIGYVVAQEFEPLQDDAFTYRPGNQLDLRVAIDRTFGDAGKAALMLRMQQYDDDQIDGANLFRSGDRYEAVGSFAFATGERGAGIVYAGLLRRDEGEYREPVAVLPAQDLFFTGVGLELPAGSLRLKPTAELRVLSGDDDAGKGYTASAGGSVELPAGAATFVPTLRARFGKVELRPGAESDFTGLELGLALRFGAPGG